MTVYGTLMGGTFDIHGIAETNVSLVRNKSTIRLTYKDEQNRLISFVKSDEHLPKSGDLLVVKNGVLMPIRDRHSTVTVAKLLADFNTSTQTKIINNKTAHLLPVQIM